MLRNAALYFILLAALAVPAFWPSYISREAKVDNVRVHLHGLVMASWCALLIAQALLIRTGRREIHRALGRTSYVLAPMIVVSTLSLAHLRVRAAGADLPQDLLYFLYVQLNLLAIFAVAYVQGIRHRREPLVHAGYMICTALTLVDPILARLLYHHAQINPPLMQLITYALIDAILVWLVFWGRRQPRPVTLFAPMLMVFVVLQLPTFFIAQTATWRAFAQAFGALPFL
jgi:uncharacterized membrane protein